MQSSPDIFLTFAIGTQRFGIPIADIQEIIRAVSLTQLPKAPRIIEGLIDLRGAVIPVLNIRSRFQLPPKAIEPADHLVIARARQRVVGIRVDRAIAVIAMDERVVDDIGAVAPTCEYVAGVAKLPDGLVLIHDLATFLSAAEAETLDAFVEEGLPS
jgi:purine-binding chemotaxis protein CheW